MSRPFRDKNKDLVNLQVVSANDVWVKNKDGKRVLNRKQYNIYGRIEKGSDCFITSSNLKGENHKYVEDTVNLPKKTKNEIVDMFRNNNRRVVYLVRKK